MTNQDWARVQRVTEQIRRECAQRVLGRASDASFDPVIDYLLDLGDDLSASSEPMTAGSRNGEQGGSGAMAASQRPSEWEIRTWIADIDAWIDGEIDDGLPVAYSTQPLAQHWARIAKIGEEFGETIGALIDWTGQNPRKPRREDAEFEVLDELCDTALTAILALQHFHKDTDGMFDMLWARLRFLYDRAGLGQAA